VRVPPCLVLSRMTACSFCQVWYLQTRRRTSKLRVETSGRFGSFNETSSRLEVSTRKLKTG
jgi:hypothetical protein